MSLSISFDQASSHIEKHLADGFAGVFHPLKQPELSRYSAKAVMQGWSFELQIEGDIIPLHVLLPPSFPWSEPLIVLQNERTLNGPHIERDGRLCLTPSERIDPANPIGTFINALDEARMILSNALRNDFSDYRLEFHSYWNPTTSGRKIWSLLEPRGPSRRIKLRRSDKFDLVAENRAELKEWQERRFGKTALRTTGLNDALLIWLIEPLLPSEYPNTISDFMQLLERQPDSDRESVLDLVRNRSGEVLILLGFQYENGSGFAAVTFSRPKVVTSAQAGKIIADADLKKNVTRRSVARIDPLWVHGRDQKLDLMTSIREAKVVLIGTGSLGSTIAGILSQMGVGQLVFIDPDEMRAENVGRHVLGVLHLGQRKALALAHNFEIRFPHSDFVAFAESWQSAANENSKVFSDADLILSTTGSWKVEGEFATWAHQNRIAAKLVFGWLEPFATAGQAVLTNVAKPCFCCGFSSDGSPKLQVSNWSGPTTVRTPVCGGEFQPYGAVELHAVATMVASVCVDALLEKIGNGHHRLLSGRDIALNEAGGSWSEEWKRCFADGAYENRQHVRQWGADESCMICGLG